MGGVAVGIARLAGCYVGRLVVLRLTIHRARAAQRNHRRAGVHDADRLATYRTGGESVESMSTVTACKEDACSGFNLFSRPI